MKKSSEISLFLLFCVFGVDGGEVKIVSVMEGDSVTLDPLTEQFNHITWRFGDSIIAETDGYEISYTKDERLRDRLKLNHQTGSLTINNTRITDSGVYKVKINNNSRISYNSFSVTVHVFGADEDGVKRESVMEGDSVTLGTRLREKFNLIKWKFGDSGSIIAETDGNKISYTNDERFRDRLKLDHQTGSLTINNMRITDSGVYHLWIHHDYWTFIQKFKVTVYDPDLSPGAVTGIVVVVLLLLSAAAVAAGYLCYRCQSSKRGRQNDEEKTESAKEGESVPLKTDTEKQTDDEMMRNWSWIKDHETGSPKTPDSGYSGYRGKNANETLEILLLSKEDLVRARVQPTT